MAALVEPCLYSWSLYAIVDSATIADRPIVSVAEELIAGGATVLQLRNKSDNIRKFYSEALALRAVTRNEGIPLIINDRVDVAYAVDADGVHVGQSDLPAEIIRDALGYEKIVGVSVHNLSEFLATAGTAVTYFGVGTIYRTKTKENLTISGIEVLREIRSRTTKPIVAIGGITIDNMEPVFAAGADGVATVSALLETDDIAGRTRNFVQKIAVAQARSCAATKPEG